MKRKEELTAREQMFCGYMALLGMPFEAARRAGYSRRKRPSAVRELLGRADVRTQVQELQGAMQEYLPAAALAGIAKAAFGDATDAVRLATMENPPRVEELEEMDLFAVSELHRRKDGTLEVKLVDRMQALRMLLEFAQQMGHTDSVEKLVAALDRGLDRQAVQQGDVC